MTKWKDVPGYKGYQVSDSGQVRGLDRKDSAGRNWAGRVLKPGLSSSGYLLVALCENGKVKSFPVHRLVCEAFLGPARGRQVNHKNGDKADNRACNLEWVSAKENMRHSIEVLGNTNEGQANGQSKLTAKQVKQIRRLWAKGGITQVELGRHFGASNQQISQIVNRKRWKHI